MMIKKVIVFFNIKLILSLQIAMLNSVLLDAKNKIEISYFPAIICIFMKEEQNRPYCACLREIMWWLLFDELHIRFNRVYVIQLLI